MKTIVELKDEIEVLAEQGKLAARARNLQRCKEIRIQLDPLIRELGDRLCEPEWHNLANEGLEMIARIDWLQKSRRSI